MPLIRNGVLVEDEWTAVADGAPLPADRPAIVSFERWRNHRRDLAGRNAALGVRLESKHAAADIAADLKRFALVAIDFPTFRDGRGFSTARLLRERYGFTGELRAIGNVLRDQFAFMHRCGFDAFEVADAAEAEAFGPEMARFSVVYQRACDRRVPATALRHLGRAAE